MSEVDDALRFVFEKQEGNSVIYREEAIDALRTITMYEGRIPFDTAVFKIQQLSPAPVYTRKKGRWLSFGYSWDPPMGVMCSKCGFKTYNKMHAIFGDTSWNFCPYCGANMR